MSLGLGGRVVGGEAVVHAQNGLVGDHVASHSPGDEHRLQPLMELTSVDLDDPLVVGRQRGEDGS